MAEPSTGVDVLAFARVGVLEDRSKVLIEELASGAFDTTRDRIWVIDWDTGASGQLGGDDPERAPIAEEAASAPRLLDEAHWVRRVPCDPRAALAALYSAGFAGRGSAERSAINAPMGTVLMTNEPDGRDLAPWLAHRFGLELVTDIVEVGADHLVRASRSGEYEAVRTGRRAVVLTIADTRLVPTLDYLRMGVTCPPALAPDLRPEGPMVRPEGAVTVRSTSGPDAATMGIAEARRIIGLGDGVGNIDSVELAFTVAAALDASVGATRVLTDAGLLPHDRQIGTTGVVVNPELYVAFGISGAVQHTAGLGTPQHVISVNTDSFCPMMAMADLAICSDANEVLVELQKRCFTL